MLWNSNAYRDTEVNLKRVWVNKAYSFEDAGKFDRDYYFGMSASARLETMQLLREEYFKIKKGYIDESGKRLRRVIRIIQ